jgi:hypothetical protein
MIRSARPLLFVAMILLGELAGIEARAPARDTIAIMRTRHHTFRKQANAQEDLKASLDKLDQDILHAAQLGRTGELRRLDFSGRDGRTVVRTRLRNHPSPDLDYLAIGLPS